MEPNSNGYVRIESYSDDLQWQSAVTFPEVMICKGNALSGIAEQRFGNEIIIIVMI